MTILDTLGAHHGAFLTPTYSNLPLGRYVHVLLLRHTQSECIFRTEGTGEPICREVVTLDGGAASTERVVITKRKQVAVERRTGRELLRDLGLLRKPDKGDELCLLNSNQPCERCIDCWLYGFAAGGGGAQRSRVMTEDAFSLLPATEVVDSRTSNATYDNGTMRHPTTGEASQALFESEYVKPGVTFLDAQVIKDVQAAELVYVLGNILRSSRYGATGTRIGHVQNRVLGLLFAHHEVTSNLEWTAQTTASLMGAGVELRHPMPAAVAAEHALKVAEGMAGKAFGRVDLVTGDRLEALLGEVRAAYEDPAVWLGPLASSYDGLTG